MKKIDNTKATAKQSDKTHVLFRFGKMTFFEYYSDISREEYRIVIFNNGYKNEN